MDIIRIASVQNIIPIGSETNYQMVTGRTQTPDVEVRQIFAQYSQQRQQFGPAAIGNSLGRLVRDPFTPAHVLTDIQTKMQGLQRGARTLKERSDSQAIQRRVDKAFADREKPEFAANRESAALRLTLGAVMMTIDQVTTELADRRDALVIGLPFETRRVIARLGYDQGEGFAAMQEKRNKRAIKGKRREYILFAGTGIAGGLGYENGQAATHLAVNQGMPVASWESTRNIEQQQTEVDKITSDILQTLKAKRYQTRNVDGFTQGEVVNGTSGNVIITNESTDKALLTAMVTTFYNLNTLDIKNQSGNKTTVDEMARFTALLLYWGKEKIPGFTTEQAGNLAAAALEPRTVRNNILNAPAGDSDTVNLRKEEQNAFINAVDAMKALDAANMAGGVALPLSRNHYGVAAITWAIFAEAGRNLDELKAQVPAFVLKNKDRISRATDYVALRTTLIAEAKAAAKAVEIPTTTETEAPTTTPEQQMQKLIGEKIPGLTSVSFEGYTTEEKNQVLTNAKAVIQDLIEIQSQAGVVAWDQSITSLKFKKSSDPNHSQLDIVQGSASITLGRLDKNNVGNELFGFTQSTGYAAIDDAASSIFSVYLEAKYGTEGNASWIESTMKTSTGVFFPPSENLGVVVKNYNALAGVGDPGSLYALLVEAVNIGMANVALQYTYTKESAAGALKDIFTLASNGRIQGAVARIMSDNRFNPDTSEGTHQMLALTHVKSGDYWGIVYSFNDTRGQVKLVNTGDVKVNGVTSVEKPNGWGITAFDVPDIPGTPVEVTTTNGSKWSYGTPN
ncbi:MAG: hypothetical protein WCP97_05715 [bacterium]